MLTNIPPLNELIEVDGPRIIWPTLGVCIVCRGVKSINCRKTGSLKDKDLAYLIACIQHGYFLSRWEGQNVTNKKIFPQKCKCECDHEMNEIRIEECLYRWTCSKCGWTGVVDSSG